MWNSKRHIRYVIRSLGFVIVAVAAVGASTLHAADAKGEANKQLVQDFLRDVRQAGMAERDPRKLREVVEHYLAENYIQHSTGFAPGREGYLQGWLKQLSVMPKEGGSPPWPKPKDFQFLADGDYVVWVSEIPAVAVPGSGPADKAPKYDFNMIRIENGKLAEHWGSR